MTARSIFRSAAFGVNGPASRSLGKPAAIYPGGIAGDSTLMIAVDRQQTALALPMSATDASMTVADPTSITAYNLLSIDSEIVKTTGPPAGNIVPVTRGFDGTTPAVHLTGATVSGFVDAWHHNALVSEIEAIENALGPNLNKLPGSIYFPVPAYNFAPQTPGGALTVGNNVITLSPVPLGVNGTDTNHYLYVSGGTGTAEAVLITGGSATEGAASGTLIINCANAHSGAWTIATATAGIQETVQHGQVMYPNGFLAWIGPGSFNIYAPVTVSTSGVKIRGMGANATGVSIVPANTPAFKFNPSGSGFFNTLSDLAIGGNSSSTSGYAVTTGTGSQSTLTIERVVIQNFYSGLYLFNLVESIVRDVYIQYLLGGDGVYVDGSQTNIILFDDVIVQANKAYNSGFHVIQTGNCLFAHCSVLGANYGMLLAVTSGGIASLDMHLCYFDQSVQAGIYFGAAAGLGIVRSSFVQCWITSGAAFGVQFQAGTGRYKGLKFIGCEMSANGSNGFNIPAGVTADDIELIGCTISNNQNASGIAVDSSDPNVTLRVLGCAIGNGFGDWGTGTQQIGISMGPAGNLIATGNSILRNTSAAIVLPTAAQNHVIANNSGVDDTPVTVASAASIALPSNTVISITGTTTVTTMTGYWTGRTVILTKTDTGSVTIGGGGNIAASHTLSQNGSLRLVWNGAGWL